MLFKCPLHASRVCAFWLVSETLKPTLPSPNTTCTHCSRMNSAGIAIAKNKSQWLSPECAHSKVPSHPMASLGGKEPMASVIDIASNVVETPEQVAAMIDASLK